MKQNQTFKWCNICHTDKDINEFFWANVELGYRMSECKDCSKERKTLWRKLRREDNRMRILHKLGGIYKCNRCGFTHETSSPFDWHHLDGNVKEDSPMKLIHNNWKKLEKELDKCEFLCANCHRIEHHG